jgi:hypothetical protein
VPPRKVVAAVEMARPIFWIFPMRLR